MFNGANDIIKNAVKFANAHAQVESNNAINAISNGIRDSLRHRVRHNPELRKHYAKTPKLDDKGNIVKDADGNIQYKNKTPSDFELAESLLRNRKGDFSLLRAGTALSMPFIGVAGIADILD